ncbi:MAG TPA: hypothetical protein VK536_06300 [Candidatus Limnocylindrales bacterium]|nr:hypothetical protein [Candidatus Limnocylindrales bacterium]
MSGVSVDHVVSIIILLVAVMLFVGLFDQTLSSAVNYQRNSTTAKECDDLVDEMLLTSAPPISGTPAWFGLQGSMLQTYNLDPFLLMRLDSSAEPPLSYQKTGQTYSEIKANPNTYLLYPYDDMINSSTALALMGLNADYGFQLTLTPTINVSISEASANPLTLSLFVTGASFPLANSWVNCLLLPISLNANTNCPEFGTVQTQSVQTSNLGQASVTFANFVPNPNLTFVVFAYANLDGISGIGYYVNPPVGSQSIIPFLDPLSTLDVTLANSNDVPTTSTSASTLYYNSTFIFESENYQFEQGSIGGSSSGSVTSGPGNLPPSISMGDYTPGVLVIAYKNAGNSGVAMMPWGFSSLGFSLTFGKLPVNQSWIATDMRQVEINSVSYQATLYLWSTQSYGGIALP